MTKRIAPSSVVRLDDWRSKKSPDKIPVASITVTVYQDGTVRRQIANVGEAEAPCLAVAINDIMTILIHFMGR